MPSSRGSSLRGESCPGSRSEICRPTPREGRRSLRLSIADRSDFYSGADAHSGCICRQDARDTDVPRPPFDLSALGADWPTSDPLEGVSLAAPVSSGGSATDILNAEPVGSRWRTEAIALHRIKQLRKRCMKVPASTLRRARPRERRPSRVVRRVRGVQARAPGRPGSDDPSPPELIRPAARLRGPFRVDRRLAA